MCEGQKNGFSSDFIAIEIKSPDCPDLTLIDLPGIVRTAVSGQSQGVITEVNSVWGGGGGGVGRCCGCFDFAGRKLKALLFVVDTSIRRLLVSIRIVLGSIS